MNFIVSDDGVPVLSDSEEIIITVESASCGEILGDLDGDCDVDKDDFNIFYASFGSCDGQSNFNPSADYDGDGCITFVDYQIWYGYFLSQ